MKSLFTKEFWELYTIVFAFVGFIAVTILFSYFDITNHFYVEKSFLRCSQGEYVKTEKDFEFECKNYDVIQIGKERIDASDKKILAQINDHCIKFSANGRCSIAVMNYSASEVKELVSGEKTVKSDLLGYLK